MALTWKPGDKYYMKSDPPGYIINKTFNGPAICAYCRIAPA